MDISPKELAGALYLIHAKFFYIMEKQTARKVKIYIFKTCNFTG